MFIHWLSLPQVQLAVAISLSGGERARRAFPFNTHVFKLEIQGAHVISSICHQIREVSKGTSSRFMESRSRVRSRDKGIREIKRTAGTAEER